MKEYYKKVKKIDEEIEEIKDKLIFIEKLKYFINGFICGNLLILAVVTVQYYLK